MCCAASYQRDPVSRAQGRYTAERHVLEFPGSQVRLRANISSSVGALFGHVGIGCRPEHTLQGVYEEYTHESVPAEGRSVRFSHTYARKKLMTYMNDIFRPYAIFATTALVERKVKSFFLSVYGIGATSTQKVAISAASSMKVIV